MSQKLRFAVVGLGASGLSAAQFLANEGHTVAVTDGNTTPSLADQLPASVARHFGAINGDVLVNSDCVIISPGIDPRIAPVAAAKAAGVPVISDVELFVMRLREQDATSGKTTPIVAITGSNAKSTVTTLVGEMARAAGLAVGVGGNIGTPALKLLELERLDLVVLELSSFQLEHISDLGAAAATILNISADHLDRHDGMADYLAQKLRIFDGVGTAVIWADDGDLAAACREQLAVHSPKAAVLTTSQAGDADLYLQADADGLALYHQGARLLAADELKIKGKHNLLNALSALALGLSVDLPMAAMLSTLRAFKGLPHRCEYVDEVAGKVYFNDSKGTNIGSTLAAIDGLGAVYGERSLALILGGQGKGQDFAQLAADAARFAEAIFIIGVDAKLIAEDLVRADGDLAARVHLLETLDQAVCQAAATSVKVVLLSPACASLDQFKNYAERGEAFVAAVNALPR